MRVASQDALEPSHLVAVSWLCFRVVALRTEKRAGAWTSGLLGEPLAPHAPQNLRYGVSVSSV